MYNVCIWFKISKWINEYLQEGKSNQNWDCNIIKSNLNYIFRIQIKCTFVFEHSRFLRITWNRGTNNKLANLDIRLFLTSLPQLYSLGVPHPPHKWNMVDDSLPVKPWLMAIKFSIKQSNDQKKGWNPRSQAL